MRKQVCVIVALAGFLMPFCAHAAQTAIVCVDEKNETLRFDLDIGRKLAVSGKIENTAFPSNAPLHATEDDYSWDYKMPGTGTGYHFELDRSTLLMKFVKAPASLGFSVVFRAKCVHRERQL